MPERLGILGGTFDPVHYGHLRLAEEARAALGLDCVLWLPAGNPPHRAGPAATADQRLEMVRLAVAGNPHFAVDAAEAQSPAPSYTVATLQRLRRELGADASLVLLLGADAFATLPDWHRWQELFDLAHIAVATRPQHPLAPALLPAPLAAAWQSRRREGAACLAKAAAGCIVAFALTALDIAATRIRTGVAQGASPRYLLPDPVLDYIDRHNLYR